MQVVKKLNLSVSSAANYEDLLSSNSWKSHLNSCTTGSHQDLPQKLDELAINNKKHHLQLTNDYPWSSLPSSTYSTRERKSDVGCAWSFQLTLIAFAAEDNIIISSCRPQSTQLVNNKPSRTEACEATANPGIIPLLLLLFAHYFSSPLAEDSQLNYFHPIVFFYHKGQISTKDRQHLKMPLFLFSLPFLTLDHFSAHEASQTVSVGVSGCCKFWT